MFVFAGQGWQSLVKNFWLISLRNPSSAAVVKNGWERQDGWRKKPSVGIAQA